MKKITEIFLALNLISLILSCTFEGKSSIEENVYEGYKEATKLKEKFNPSSMKKNAKTLEILGKGYSHWNEESEAAYYKGVSREIGTLKKFLNNILFKNLQFEDDERERVNELFLTLEFTAGIDLVGEDFIFQRKESRNGGSYFLVYAEQNCKNENQLDFLEFKIESKFNLSPDIFILEQGKGNIFYGKYKHTLEKRPKDLTSKQLNELRTYFQICSFFNIDHVIKTINNF